MASLAPDAILPPNEPHTWELAVHCGAGFLRYKINGTWWRTAEAGSTSDWMPTGWPDANSTTGITVFLELNTAGDQLKVAHAGRTVVYAPTKRLLTSAMNCCHPWLITPKPPSTSTFQNSGTRSPPQQR